ncbi:hypothetical protein N7489_006957 [Penicillium chrysogenum]|uniref:Uncharacterized protein n=1 Tax=Penicillium chrysogenum TaxID=5076 RepID=A0ABQ8W6F9_PENCH|nr:uncharacterized protein N7489_006957 [Penicillium chrysogenum]XP_061070979.1 uncharacterized protein N7525_001073 [Penicillium rubens]KAJ5236866.1 hypothetical protein N7489_006957 [Penicillium chrysogenum]KAJ5255765.1 hypothetical protein N7505_010916 [Penicillium chrysogenum]KAJ5276827.1 hypothetical protein N7524_002980 [Penicillium chrysogenum]KAJ5843332.1 hypothetical protein N7525_001073 [Penicillium rubens]KAJ5846084.1 hypothetical protein N7534_009753 [Penicillium rubens]
MNPQNLAFLFITHDFGLYRWSSLFYAWHFCLALHDIFHHFHLSLSSLATQMEIDSSWGLFFRWHLCMYPGDVGTLDASSV